MFIRLRRKARYFTVEKMKPHDPQANADYTQSTPTLPRAYSRTHTSTSNHWWGHCWSLRRPSTSKVNPLQPFPHTPTYTCFCRNCRKC